MNKMKKTTNDIKVSVIIPVYNAESVLRECLDSVVNQTLKDIEIICVDDESTDGSIAILEEYAKKDKRITVLEQKHSNAGVARNAGVAIAKGAYLSFLDADDYYDITLLEKVYQAAQKDPEIDIVIFGANLYNDVKGTMSYSEMSIIEKFCLPENPFYAKDMHEYIFNAFQNWVWNKFFKTSFIKEKNIYFHDVKRSNDALFVCSALSTARKIYILREALIIHRTNQKTNMQANNIDEPDAFMKAYEKIYERLKELHGDDFELYRQSFYSRTLLSTRYYIDTVRSDPLAYSFVKHLIAYKGERVFHFSEYDADYFYSLDHYYSKDLYQWYMNLLNEVRNENNLLKAERSYRSSKEYRIGSAITWLPRKIKKIGKSFKNNGLLYTARRILFHLHLAEDNDPERTAKTAKRNK